MKKNILLILMAVGAFTLKAQDEKTFTDEELTTYASVMVWAENEQGVLSETLVTRIKEDSVLKGTRYNDLKDAYGDEAKLKEVKATDAEVLAYEKIIVFEDSIKENFKEVYVGKIKDDITVSLYNELKSALKSDDEVKIRYQEIYSTLKEESAGDNEDDSSDL